MVRAYVLIKTKTGAQRGVKNALQALMHVKEVSMITGQYDIIAVVETKDTKTLGEVVAMQIPNIDGVEETCTCIAVD